MEIQLKKEVLLTPLSIVAGVVERRQTLPILSYLLLHVEDGKIQLVGTDLEVEMMADVEGRTDGLGDVTLPARKLLDICRALPEESLVKIAKEETKVTVKSGRSRFALVTLPADDFPKIEATAFKQAFTIEAQKLKKLLDATAFCMAQQDVRYYLNGLYLEIEGEGMRAVATDGHRMAITRSGHGSASTGVVHVIVPRKAIQEIIRLLPNTDEVANIDLSANHLRLQLNGFQFTTKLIDGKFPEYTKVIPTTQSKKVVLNRDDFRESLGRAAILANEKYRGVRLNLEEGRLCITAHNPEQEEAVEEIEIEYKGEPLEIGFNVNYLMDATSALDSNEVILGLNDSSSSCTLKSADDPETQYIIMPMRL